MFVYFVCNLREQQSIYWKLVGAAWYLDVSFVAFTSLICSLFISFCKRKCQCWWFLMKHIHVDKRLRYLHWRLPALLSLYWSRAIVGWSELTLPSSGMKISWTKTGVILKETCNILHERYKHLSIKAWSPAVVTDWLLDHLCVISFYSGVVWEPDMTHLFCLS